MGSRATVLYIRDRNTPSRKTSLIIQHGGGGVGGRGGRVKHLSNYLVFLSLYTSTPPEHFTIPWGGQTTVSLQHLVRFLHSLDFLCSLARFSWPPFYWP
jgi:hypothetical protein